MNDARPDDERITFRCLYPDNCNCCPSNREAFIAVGEDAERMKREQKQDMDRMERASETIERLSAEVKRLSVVARGRMAPTTRDYEEFGTDD